MKTIVPAIVLSMAALASCSQDRSGDRRVIEDRNAAAIALSRARIDAYTRKPVDVEALKAMPGMPTALSDWAESARLAAAMKTRTPNALVWGPTWTTDYVQLCGTFTGPGETAVEPVRFVSIGEGVLFETDADFTETLWGRCSGPRTVILPATPQPDGATPQGPGDRRPPPI